MIEVGQKVKDKEDGTVGVVLRICDDGSLIVLEEVEPMTVSTYRSADSLEVIPNMIYCRKTI